MRDFWLAENGAALRGCAAVWDQRGFKQVTIAGYARWLGATRALVNVGRVVAGHPPLPAPGSRLRLGFLSHLAGDPASFSPLLSAAADDARGRGLDFLSSTLDAASPWAEIASGAAPARLYRSILYAVTPADRSPRILDDCGFSGSAPIHVEGATL
jgi:hypothetical protein